MQEMLYRCCFCNTMIESNQVDPCDLNILINVDKPKEKQDNQTFYCHVRCFEERLHENIRNYLIVHFVENEEDRIMKLLLLSS